jgi:CO/xanthine dehydrogenase Mo-binding subunit
MFGSWPVTIFPEAAGSGGSFGAASSGSALFEACRALREKLAWSAGMDPDTARFSDGHIAAGERSVRLIELVGSQCQRFQLGEPRQRGNLRANASEQKAHQSNIKLEFT